MAIEIEIEQKSSVSLSKVAMSKLMAKIRRISPAGKPTTKTLITKHATPPSLVIQMGLAENQNNTWRKIQTVAVAAAALALERTHCFKIITACCVSERGGRAKFNPERVVITAGATAANELLTFIIAHPGDALLVPTPYYPGFDRDLRWRTGVKIVPVHCHSSNNFKITAASLDAAYEEAAANNIRVRGLLITNPSNPLGATIKRAALDQILDFAARRNIHLISDEIYSGSAFSPNEFTQQLLATMLSDVEFTRNNIETNRKRLKKRYDMIVDGLGEIGIEYLNGNAGLSFLKEESKEEELELWKLILHEVKFNISPGFSCRCSDPDWFRVCFANMTEQTLQISLTRMREFMERRRA
ncbi:hypothetical protein SASPL_114506 [Salvia splendens]|uniref:Aminotransferase class I/classII large domain-containing protein n=1 Tax=Salvia splendens TaxID=180675 RepID=A0A8X9A238_SALSN|nr:hypothetical protein SASPL_114506 [Salvia splendens]